MDIIKFRNHVEQLRKQAEQARIESDDFDIKNQIVQEEIAYEKVQHLMKLYGLVA